MIRVLLADDEELIRDALAALLDPETDLTVVARAADGRGGVEAARVHRPDVAVVDLQMPGLDGLEVTAELAWVLPSCAVVILTGRGRPAHAAVAKLGVGSRAEAFRVANDNGWL